MKVLCILDNLSIASGVSAIVMNLYRNMDLDRVQMDFLVCNQRNASFEGEIKQRGGNIFYTGNFLSPCQIVSALLKSKKFFAKHVGEYDIVHLHSPTIALFTLKYAKQHGIPIRIVHSHSTMMSMSKLKNVINNYLIRKIKKYANVFFACSTEAAQFLYGKDFCATHKIELIHNAVNCSKFMYDPELAKTMRERLEIKDTIAFVHVSNYSPIKNHVFLLDVIEQFKVAKKKVKFIFIGNGSTRKSFEEKVVKKGLNQFCIFIDKTPDVAQYLLAADAIILPSLKEGLPVALIEGQAMGLPFFTSDTVTREVLVGQGEFIYLSTKQWYEKLSKFTPLNEYERKKKSEDFQKTCFNINMEAKRVTDIYEKLIKKE